MLNRIEDNLRLDQKSILMIICVYSVRKFGKIPNLIRKKTVCNS